MRFVGRVAIILVLATAAAVVHSMYTPIYRDLADKRARAQIAASTGAPDARTAGEPQGDQGDQGDAQSKLPAGDAIATDSRTPIPEAMPASEQDPPQQDLPDYYISVDRAYEFWEEGMPFVDARTDAERAVGTVEGAVHLEVRHFLNGTAAGKLADLDHVFPVIVFCGGGECDASENVAKRLDGWGFTEVYIMHEGYGAWEAAGHPTQAIGG